VVIEAQAVSSEEQRASVFISYSRKDKDFVRRLAEALKKRDRSIWVDLESIAPTAEWLEEVYSGIESTNAFVFVISPDSVKSEDCLREHTHALKHNKKLIPIVRQEVDEEAVPEPLGSYNWIFFREDDDFEQAFQDLVYALDTDLNWVREHTRLLTRAIEWEDTDRNNSFLLRGSDLRAAEEWQVRAAEEEPKLTPLQIEYILASRRATARRQRLTLSAVTVGLIIAVVLGVFAWSQRNEAIEQREEAVQQREKAERQANIALSRLLMAQSGIVRNQQDRLLERSVLLAIEAMRRFPSAEAGEALRGGMTLLPGGLVTRVDHDELINEVAFDSESNYMVTTSYDNTARVWEAATGREIARLEHEDVVHDAAFDLDGERVATASADGTARVWDVATGEAVARMAHQDGVLAVDFSPDGERLATAGEDGTARVWEASTGKEIVRVQHEDLVRDAVFSPSGERVATASADGTARVWDVATGEEVARMQHGGEVNSVAFSPEGERVATASADGTARVWQVATGKEVVSLPHESAVLTAVFAPGGERLATASEGEVAHVWQVATGKEVARMEHEDLVADVEFDPEGKYLATASEDGTARVWEASTGKEITRIAHQDGVLAVDFSPDGERLATGSFDNSAMVWKLSKSVTSDPEVVIMPHEGPTVSGATFSPNGEYLATADPVNGAHVWEVATGKEIARMNPEEYVGDVAFSDDGKYVASEISPPNIFNPIVLVWEVATGNEVTRIEHINSDVAFSPEGRYLAAASEDGTARVWAMATGKEVARIQQENIVSAVALSAGGEYLATSSDDTTHVWEVATGREVAQMVGRLLEPTFSGNGQYLATSDMASFLPSEDGTIRLWEVSTSKEVARLPHEAGENLGLAISPDGNYFATVSPRNTARVWEVATGKEVGRMEHEGNVYHTAFSEDGEYLATASSFSVLHVWEVATGKEATRMQHEQVIDIVTFSPDSKYLASAAALPYGDASARVWLWRSADLIDEACSRLSRNLTRDEWQLYVGDEPYRKTCPNLPEPA
jgi:WD40 repeat protein